MDIILPIKVIGPFQWCRIVITLILILPFHNHDVDDPTGFPPLRINFITCLIWFFLLLFSVPRITILFYFFQILAKQIIISFFQKLVLNRIEFSMWRICCSTICWKRYLTCLCCILNHRYLQQTRRKFLMLWFKHSMQTSKFHAVQNNAWNYGHDSVVACFYHCFFGQQLEPRLTSKCLTKKVCYMYTRTF